MSIDMIGRGYRYGDRSIYGYKLDIDRDLDTDMVNII